MDLVLIGLLAGGRGSGEEVSDPLLPIPLFPPSLSLTFTEGQNLPSESCLAVGTRKRRAAGRTMTATVVIRSMVPEAIYFPPPRTSSTPLYSSLLPSLLAVSSLGPSVAYLVPLPSSRTMTLSLRCSWGIPRKIDYGRHRHGVYKIAYKIALGNKLHGSKEVARRGEKASWAISAQLSVIHSGPYGEEHALRQTCLPLAYFLSSYCLAVTSNFLDGDARMRRRSSPLRSPDAIIKAL